MRVAVVHNTRVSNPGLVGAALSEAGAEIATFRPHADGTLPDTGHDALVVFGGEQAATADATHPYLPALAQLMRAYGEAGRAVLGICLGAQILARGYGAENMIGTAPEFGWCEISARGSDPVLAAAAGAGGRFTSFQWHSDTFSLPAGASHLAAGTRVANQAFRLGRAAYGTQFHFEADAAVVSEWAAAFPGEMRKMDAAWPDALDAQTARHGPASDAAGRALARAWVALI
ncbi:MAG: GMP synthase [Defluviimonas sp.]|uniref:type 1 glutamine amidotransferase n=1 Tax=Albidovulum sp. TaxID=1872424 RepID=UPI001D632C83|nr:GMP synthase [Paracoccaceae bacterium]MCC0063983.1 GMP synthase [Defluviimonas sp.]